MSTTKHLYLVFKLDSGYSAGPGQIVPRGYSAGPGWIAIKHLQAIRQD